MKKLLFLVMICFIPLIVGAQSLSVEVHDGDNNSLSTFNLQDGSVSFSSSGMVFNNSGRELSGVDSYGFSPDLSVAGILSQKSGTQKVTILNGAGTMLTEYEVIDYSPTDPSLQIFPLNTGGALVRDNIVSFNLYDSFGNNSTTISSGGQSSGGQVISEVAMDSEGRTIIVFTPQVKNNGSRGSRAGRIDLNRKLDSIYFSRDRLIKDLQVSGDGQFVVIITEKEGTDDQVLILDKYGNQINKMESSENLKSASISADAEYITVYSEGRAAVYEMLSGKRLGSTSFGSSLILAHYFTEDEILLALSGDMSQNDKGASNLEFHAIHLGKRAVERQEFSGTVGFNPALKYYFERVAPGRYQLKGANKLLEISAQF
ncbi:MAG: hypothetical protein U5J95_00130 [Balneolaceae bacterium]|nr:hypothetical protein [Balneolaceae bacterium]